MKDILVKYPSRCRPDIFQHTLTLYRLDPCARFLITLDHDDETMNTPEMHGWLGQLDRTKVRWGNSENKIQAVNDGVADEPWDLLILASDDMIPQRKDYARRINELFDIFFPNGDGLLHLDDGRTGKKLNTLPIMDRKYFDRFGYLYHRSYKSLWCDNEMQDVAEALERSVYLPECVIRHEWVRRTGADELHQYNERFKAIDAFNYQKRRAAGFPTN